MATKGRLALSILTAALASGALLAAVPQATVAQRATASTARLLAERTQLGLDADHGFTMALANSDNLNQVHAHFQQTYQGVKVWGGQAITHVDNEGTELPMTNALFTGIHINTNPALGVSEALGVAHADLAPKGPYAQEPTAELVIYPQTTMVRNRHTLGMDDAGLNSDNFDRQVLHYTLAYHVHTSLMNGTGETSQWDYMVNANTGAIITKWNDLHNSAAVGTGNSQYSGTVSLNTNSTTSGFELRDMTRGTGGTFGNNVVTNLNHATSGNGTVYTDADNTWGDGTNYTGSTTSTTSATGQTAAVDAAFGIQCTWDMYKNVLGRNGIDGAGKASYLRVHYSTSYDNAFWDDTCFCMTFGDGSQFKSLESVDVAGHEMSHGVIANSVPGGLTYSGESGGLNESNSDVFGTSVEFYDLGGGEAAHATTVPSTGGNWTIGEQLETSSFPTPLRYMYKPSKDGTSPDAWSSSVGSLDVHYSSGPGNREFYFLSMGASATSSSDFYSSYTPAGFAGVGIDHATRIHYRAMTTYYTSSETYSQARAAHISAAKDLYGAGSAEEQAAWNSFAAINVGAKWTGTGTAPAITTQPANVTVTAPATATFSVVASGTAPFTYQWFKGTASISGATAASYTTPATSSADNGTTFHVTVTNSAGSATSNNATLTVNSTATAPSITSQPASVTVNAGSTASFSVSASGTAPFTYQWRKNGTSISGATAASYTTPATVSSDNGSTFSVVVTNSVGSATSNNATLTVNTVSGTTFPEVESNNTIASANVVGRTYTAIQGNLSTTGDTDFFALTLNAGETLAVAMTGPSGVDWDLKLVNSAGTQLAISQGSTTTENLSYKNSGTSTMTVYINPYIYSGTSATPYNLALTYTGSGPVDTTPPTCSASESGTSGTITFSATASDNIGVTKVEFYVDGVLKGTDTTSPYSMTFDSTTLTNASHTLTSKAYDAAGNVGTSTSVSFTVSNTTTQTQLMVNGGFESSTTGWAGTTGDIGAWTGEPAHAGTRDCWLLGNGTTASENIGQTVAIPAATASATLTFYLHIDTAETTTSTAYDTLKVQVRNSSGTVLGTLATYSNLNKAAGYALKTFDLTSYKGQTVQVYFLGAEDSSLQTSFVIDDVSLIVK